MPFLQVLPLEIRELVYTELITTQDKIISYRSSLPDIITINCYVSVSYLLVSKAFLVELLQLLSLHCCVRARLESLNTRLSTLTSSAYFALLQQARSLSIEIANRRLFEPRGWSSFDYQTRYCSDLAIIEHFMHGIGALQKHKPRSINMTVTIPSEKLSLHILQGVSTILPNEGKVTMV